MRVAWVSLLAAACLVVRATAARADAPPDYRVPAAHCARFDAERIRLTLVETSQAPNRSFFAAEPETESTSDEQYPVAPQVSRRALVTSLSQRVARYASGRTGDLELEVTLLELAVQVERPQGRHATVEVRVRRPGGPWLITTRGTSKLVGRLGGMDPRTREELEVSVIDAFERAVLREAFIVATNRALAQTPSTPESSIPPITVAEPAAFPPVSSSWRIESHEGNASAHVAGVTFDAGKAYSLGVRYLHDHLQSRSGVYYGGYGAEARVLSSDGSPSHAAVAALGVLRGGMAVEQGVSLELAGGVARGSHTLGLLSVGAFLGLYYAEVGGSVQIPLAVDRRPDWLSPLAFAVRLSIPFHRTSHSLVQHSPLPLKDPLPPGFRKPTAQAR
jgi:hypothetical protein